MRMKKMAALFGAVLIAATALAFTACDNRGGNNPIWTSAVNETAPTIRSLDVLDGWTRNGSSGTWFRFSRSDAQGASTEYGLYNIVSDQLFTADSSFDSLKTGLYYTSEVTAPTDPDADIIVNYTFYDMYGEVVRATSEEVSLYGGDAVFRDGRYFALMPDGSYEIMNAQFGKNFTGSSDIMQVGGYFLDVYSSDSIIIDVYDGNRTFVKSVNVTNEKNLPGANWLDDATLWDIGGKLFFQLTERVPYDISYDVVDNGSAYCLYTLSYDPAADKLEEVKNFGFLVTGIGDKTPSQDAIVLRGGQIEGKKVVSSGIQMFGADGKLYTDLQKLLPNATKLQYSGNYAVLSSDEEMKVYNSGELAYSFDKKLYGSTMEFHDGYLFANYSVYTLDGTKLFDYEPNMIYCYAADGVLWFRGGSYEQYGYNVSGGDQQTRGEPSDYDGDYYMTGNADNGMYSVYCYKFSAPIVENVTMTSQPSLQVISNTDSYTDSQYDLVCFGEDYYRVVRDAQAW